MIVVVSIISMLFDYLDVYLYNINPGIIRAMRFLRVVRGEKIRLLFVDLFKDIFKTSFLELF